MEGHSGVTHIFSKGQKSVTDKQHPSMLLGVKRGCPGEAPLTWGTSSKSRWAKCGRTSSTDFPLPNWIVAPAASMTAARTLQCWWETACIRGPTRDSDCMWKWSVGRGGHQSPGGRRASALAWLRWERGTLTGRGSGTGPETQTAPLSEAWGRTPCQLNTAAGGGGGRA